MLQGGMVTHLEITGEQDIECLIKVLPGRIQMPVVIFNLAVVV